MEFARQSRWLAIAVPVVLASGVALARPAPPGAVAAAPRPEAPCAATVQAAASVPGGARPAWYRLDPALDAAGTLVGQRLHSGRGAVQHTAMLPPESFASGPVRGLVLVGEDDGARSGLRLLDTATGCWSPIADEPWVVRSGVMTPDGAAMYEHRVDRATRRDLGVWRRELGPGRGGAAVEVLPGLAPDARFGPTFATSLSVAPDGRLVVATCGERACRVRVAEPSSGRVASASGVGAAVGVTGSRLVARDGCDGLPCPLIAIDLATGRSSAVLDEASGPAVLAPDGQTVVLADEDGLGVVALAATGPDREVAGSTGLAPVGASSTSTSGIEAPPGLVAVAPLGRVDDPSSVRFLDPASLQLSPIEVLP